ncbi:MAG TPA: PRC-barrel domain-containing protein [Thermoanaerobaculia bacterium]|nr:PRC-barrel domain-containing protein [Thermoanaerobaculia bacterium]
MSHKEESRERLMLLSELKDLRVSKGEPDIRGWDVVTADRKKMGKVHELVIDTIDMKVRYLDIDVDGKILDLKDATHMLIPIAGAQLDDDDNRVYLTEITVDELRALPPYDHRRITRDFEANIASWFTRSRATTPAPETLPPVTATERPLAPPPAATMAPPADTADPFYEQEHLSDRGFWGKRRKGREDTSYIAPEELDRDRR